MLTPDTRLRGRYRVTGGPQATAIPAVYEADDEQDKRAVTLEIYPLAEGPGREAMAAHLSDEAKALAAVSGGCLPAIIDHWAEDDCFYLVREQVCGVSLGETLSSGPLPLVKGRLPTWVGQLLIDLEKLHGSGQGLVHDQIRPEHLLLDGSGGIKLVGYRLGATSDGVEPERKPRGDPYAAHERVLGSDPDWRSDVYSLGAVLFHGLTGESPPSAVARTEKYAIAKTDSLQRAHALRTNIPESISAILARALALKPKMRTMSVRDLREELISAGALQNREEKPQAAETVTSTPTTPGVEPDTSSASVQITTPDAEQTDQSPIAANTTVPGVEPTPLPIAVQATSPEVKQPALSVSQPPPKRMPWPALIVGLLVVMGSIGVGIWFLIPVPPPPSDLVLIDPTTAPEMAELTSATLGSSVISMAFQPQTQRLAVGLSSGMLELRDAQLASVATLDVGDRINSVVLGPEVEQLLVALQNEQNSVQEILIDGQKLTPGRWLAPGSDVSDVRSIAISANSNLLAVGVTDRKIFVQPLDGSSDAVLLLDPSGSFGTVVGLAFLDDDRLIAASTSERSGSITVWSQVPETNPPEWRPMATITPTGGEISQIAVDVERELIISATMGNNAADAVVQFWNADGSNARPDLPLKQGTVFSMDISPDGQLLAIGLNNGAVIVYDLSGAAATVIWSAPDDAHGGKEVRAIRFSHDGKLLATADSSGKVWLWGVREPRP